MIRCLCVFMTLLFTVSLAGQQQGVRPEFRAVVDEPGLPRVLIIGDSISIAYTLPLREALKGVANVHRPPENCRSTWYGLEKLDEWLGDGKWDVIYFNWGLHDLKYITETGGLAMPPRGKQVASVEEYAVNLEKLVQRMRETGAALIWRMTTPVPAGSAGRFEGAEYSYNLAALKVMKKYRVSVDNLNVFIQSQNIQPVKPGNVHFSPEDSAKMGRHAAQLIERALKDPAISPDDRVNRPLPEITDKIEVREGLVYAQYGERKLKLDLYLPKERTGSKTPAVLLIHGGGFRVGDIKKYAPHAARLANEGFVAAAMEYRLLPEAKGVRECAYDAKAAVRWLRANADEFGIDAERIGAFGGSAGAFLVNVLATISASEFEGNGGNAGVSSQIQAAVSMAGSGDFMREGHRERFGLSLQEAKAMSPIAHIESQTPPFLLVHCIDDSTVPYSESEKMKTKLDSVGAAAELVTIRNCRHAFWHAEYGFDQVMEPAASFFRRTLQR